MRRSLAIPRMGLPLGALAQPAWPSRPVRLLTGTPAGDSTDASARQIAQRLSMALGQSVFVMGGSVDCAFDAGVSTLSQPR